MSYIRKSFTLADAGSRFLIPNISTKLKQNSLRLNLTLVLGVSAVHLFKKFRKIGLNAMSL
jgi:hypothetical protein